MHREYENSEEKKSEISEIIFFKFMGAKKVAYHFWKSRFDSYIKERSWKITA